MPILQKLFPNAEMLICSDLEYIDLEDSLMLKAEFIYSVGVFRFPSLSSLFFVILPDRALIMHDVLMNLIKHY